MVTTPDLDEQDLSSRDSRRTIHRWFQKAFRSPSLVGEGFGRMDWTLAYSRILRGLKSERSAVASA
jgi:hypothetical protein